MFSRNLFQLTSWESSYDFQLQTGILQVRWPFGYFRGQKSSPHFPFPPQVTLTAETDCSFITWPRRQLYLLLARERYIARLFSVLLGYDISEKLYALNEKLFAKFGLRFDIRLPSLYHVLEPAPSDAEVEPEPAEPEEPPVPSRPPVFVQRAPPASCAPPPLAPARIPRPDSDLSGEDSTSLVLEDFAELTGSFMDYVSEGEYMK